jgi:DNA-binding NtrC family response regulator
MNREEFQVLVVDDEKNICDLLKQALEQAGCVVKTTCEHPQVLEWCKQFQFDAIFLDIKMPGMNGVELLKILRGMQTQAAFVMITGFAGSELVDESLSCGAFICLSKPFGIVQVLDVIKTLQEEKAGIEPVMAG